MFRWLASRVASIVYNNYINGFVRLCNNQVEFLTILNEARSCGGGPWSDDLIGRVEEYILCGAISGISVYRVKVLSSLDIGHALGVIAVGISRDDFRSTKGRKRKAHCTTGSIILPVKALDKSVKYTYSPSCNLNFHPANSFHYDLTIRSLRDFSILILDALSAGKASWSILGNDKNWKWSYCTQARVAYSHCIMRYGALNCEMPPKGWKDGKDISAKEQIKTLEHLAQMHSLERQDAS